MRAVGIESPNRLDAHLSGHGWGTSFCRSIRHINDVFTLNYGRHKSVNGSVHNANIPDQAGIWQWQRPSILHSAKLYILLKYTYTREE